MPADAPHDRTTPNAPTRPPQPERDVVIQGHKYDGIREYDNPMPGWWLWIFYVTIGFSLVYLLGVHVFGFIDTYEDDLTQSVEELKATRAAYAAANPQFEATDEALQKIVDDPAQVQAGAQQYAALCAACHGDKGQGLIGPNLTDDYWLHGGSNVQVFQVISEGVAAKGMPAWSASLSPEQRAQAVAFIRSIRGTKPEGAREPQGEPFTL